MEVSLKEAFFLLKYVTNDVPDELKDKTFWLEVVGRGLPPGYRM